jgi:hypothetical protein
MMVTIDVISQKEKCLLRQGGADIATRYLRMLVELYPYHDNWDPKFQ